MTRARASRRRPAGTAVSPPGRLLSPRTWLARHAQVALYSLGRLSRNPLATLMTAAVVGIALAMPAALGLLLHNLERLSGSWDDQAGLSAFLDRAVAADEARRLADTLRGWPGVARVTLVTPDEALAEYRQRSGFAEALDLLEENPLPAVLLVVPAPDQADPEAVAGLQERLQALPETELAQLDLQWVRRLDAMLALARHGVLLIGALLALAVLLIVGNTIRLEIENRREEIVVTRLIGATDAFIRRPFLYSGAWYGLLGALLAWLLVLAALWSLDDPVRQLADLYHSSFRLERLPLALLGALLAGGSLLGLLGSWLAVGRHLGTIAPR